RRHHDLALDDLPAQLLDGLVGLVVDPVGVVLVVDVADAVLGEAELADAADELAGGDRLDRLLDGDVDALHHAGHDAAGRLGELVGVGPDGELAARHRRVEHALAGLAGGLEDDVGALVVLRERELLAGGRVGEGLGLGAGVGDGDDALGADLGDAGAVAGL